MIYNLIKLNGSIFKENGSEINLEEAEELEDKLLALIQDEKYAVVWHSELTEKEFLIRSQKSGQKEENLDLQLVIEIERID